MSISVADCLKLTSLREAKVLAGSNGLNRIVTAVSVIEYADCSVLVNDFFVGNTIMITAFTSVKDDVDSQCSVIRRMAKMGEVGLILYYVGIFLPKVDKKLIDTANELDLPLICMPLNRFDFRYSEAISEIYEAILKNQMKESYYVPSMLDCISQLPDRQRTIDTVLRMLSDRLHCTLLLCNQMYDLQTSAAWPIAVRWDYQEILERIKNSPTLLPGQKLTLKVNDLTICIAKSCVIVDHQHILDLFTIEETGKISESDLAQATEVIQIFLNIWKKNLEFEGLEALIEAILNNDAVRIQRISSLLHFDLKSINTMWVLMENEKELSSEEIQNRNLRRVFKTKLFIKEVRKNFIVGIFNNNVVIFMNNPVFEGLDEVFAKEFIESLGVNDSSLTLVTFSRIETTTDIRNAYTLLESTYQVSRYIYPTHNILGTYEFQLAQTCLDIMQQGEETIDKVLSTLKPLYKFEDVADLIKTLEVFLLDTQNNFKETGDRLFLHQNTVKYRINKIKQRLGYSLNKMPESYNLYISIALNRLIKHQGLKQTTY